VPNGPDIGHGIGHELDRLVSLIHEVETHLEPLLRGVPMDHQMLTGLQRLDELSQVLMHLSGLMRVWACIAPTEAAISVSLAQCVPLERLRKRLQGLEVCVKTDPIELF
jgi:hypothetical protein